jgi:ankyrin repeat protein
MVLTPCSELWRASRKGDWPRVQILLTESVADIEKLGARGLTPLQIAASGGFDDVVELLVDHGADPLNIGSCDGMTMLHLAAGSGDAHGRGAGGTMRWLLKTITESKNAFSVDPIGRPVGCYGQKQSDQKFSWAGSSGQQQIGDLWLDVNARDFWGRTPLHMAAYDGTFDALEQLLNFGADHSCVNRNGETPMHTAASCCALYKCRLLQAYMNPATLNLQDHRGATALHFAASRGVQPGDFTLRPTVFAARMQRVDMVQLLINGGIDVSLKNREGKTAEDLAVEQGHLFVADLLKVVIALFGALVLYFTLTSV